MKVVARSGLLHVLLPVCHRMRQPNDRSACAPLLNLGVVFCLLVLYSSAHARSLLLAHLSLLEIEIERTVLGLELGCLELLL